MYSLDVDNFPGNFPYTEDGKKVFEVPWRKTLYTFCFHEIQERTAVIVIVLSHLSYGKRNVPIKYTKRHLWLLRELGLLGLFLLALTATIRFQIFGGI